MLSTLLLALTWVTGVVDAVSYLALGHVFTANMTGNVVFMGFALVGTPGLSATGGGVALLAFIAGAVVGGRLTTRLTAAPIYRWVSLAVAMEAALLAAAAIAMIGDERDTLNATRVYTAIVLLGVAMGIRAAAIRKLAVPDLVTVVLTMTITALAAESSIAGGRNSRSSWRVASIASMIAGAAAGALLLNHSVMLPLALCSAVSGACALTMYLRKQ